MNNEIINYRGSPVWDALNIYFAGLKPNTRRRYMGSFKELLTWARVCEGGEIKEEAAGFILSVGAKEAKSYLLYLQMRSPKGSNGENLPTQHRGVGERLSSNTISVHITALSSIWDELFLSELVRVNPWRVLSRKVKRDYNRKRFYKHIPYPAIQKAIELISPHSVKGRRNRILLGVLYYGGLRLNEACSLLIKDVSFDEGGYCVVRLRSTKAGKAQRQKLSRGFSGKVRKWVKQLTRAGLEGDDPLFPTFVSNANVFAEPYRCAGPRSVARMVKQAFDRVGVEASPHDLRKSFGSRLVDQGVDLKEVRDHMRHASTLTTERYLDVDEIDLNKLDEAFD